MTHRFRLPRLIFSYNCKEDSQLSAPLIEIFKKTPIVRESFEGVEVRFCNLPPEKDKYVRGAEHRQNSEYGGCAGPNWLFYETMQGLKSEVKFAFLMESDCYPVRPNWLSKLEQVCFENQDAWIIGTQYCGVSPLGISILRHINGNALYNIGDVAYVRFLESFLWPWMHRQIKSKNISLCYDCAWEIYLYSLASEATSNQAKVFARRNLPRFRIKNFIVNIAGGAEIEKQYVWTKSDLMRQYPNAVLIHGPFSTTSDHIHDKLAFGKPKISSGVSAEGGRLSYHGPNERNSSRFERTCWLHDRPGHPIPAESSIHLEFELKCKPKVEGVIVEFLDESRNTIGRKIAVGNGDSCATRVHFECMMNLARTFVSLRFRFFGEGDECDVALYNAALEIRNWDAVIGRTERIFD